MPVPTIATSPLSRGGKEKEKSHKKNGAGFVARPASLTSDGVDENEGEKTCVLFATHALCEAAGALNADMAAMRRVAIENGWDPSCNMNIRTMQLMAATANCVVEGAPEFNYNDEKLHRADSGKPKALLMDFEFHDGRPPAEHMLTQVYQLRGDPEAPPDALSRIDCNTGAKVYVQPKDLKNKKDPKVRAVLKDGLWPGEVKSAKIRSVFRVRWLGGL